MNNSGVTQNFETTGTTTGRIDFKGTSTAGSATIFTNNGGNRTGETGVSFYDSSNAGSATSINNGGVDSNTSSLAALHSSVVQVRPTAPLSPILGLEWLLAATLYLATMRQPQIGPLSATAEPRKIQVAPTCKSDSATARDATFTINGSDLALASAGSLSFFTMPPPVTPR